MITYNLPPWLCMKRKFMMLTMLISGPQQPGNNIDVYLSPLIDDLKTLWEVGVQIYDTYRQELFTLRAVLLWTITDFPAYGNLFGCSKDILHVLYVGKIHSPVDLSVGRKMCTCAIGDISQNLTCFEI